MRWLEVCVEATDEFAEAVSALLQRHCPGGITIEPTIAPDDDREGAYHEVSGAPLRIRAYLPIDAAIETTRAAVATSIWHLRQLLPEEPAQVTYTELDEADW